MNPVFLGHAGVFLVTAVVCFASIPRARTIQHRDTRDGFVAFLGTVGLWSLGYLGYLLAPSRGLQLASFTIGFVFAFAAVGAWLYLCAGYTGRSPRHAPYKRTILAVFLGIVVLKATNPLHQLYFTAHWVTEPFPHLAIQHGLFYWVLLGLSYAAIAVGFFLLLERFYHTGSDSRPLVFLLSLTAIPAIGTIFSNEIPGLLPLMYEPPGVALFAVGTLFVYQHRFETIRLTGDSATPSVFLDRDGRIRDYNQAAIELFPALQGALNQPIERVIPQLSTDIESTAVIELDGEPPRLVEVVVSPFTSGGVVTGKLVSMQDVTEREGYRRALEAKSEQLEVLNRMVRHDIRNDMAVITGWAQELVGHVDAEGEAALDRVLRRSNHVIELTEIAREFVESLTDETVMELHPVALGPVLETELDAVRDSYPAAEVRVVGQLPAVTVEANELLGSVFRNLLQNAVVHNDTETPIITVEVGVVDETVRVRLSDNGPGIPAQQQDRLFQKGAKGPTSAGTGIGLYLVHTLVQQYGGQISVEANQPTGTTFVVELPVARDAES